jgi:hypothetical protein
MSPIDQPVTISASSFQLAWKHASILLRSSHWDRYNLIVQISDPTSFDAAFHQRICRFCSEYSLLGPKHIAYTIFPARLYGRLKSASDLFEAYNRPNGLYDRLHRLAKHEWGTYFRRLTYYENSSGECINQLGEILEAIKNRHKVHKAAYTIVVARPGAETRRTRGAPCLNYLAIQLKRLGTGTSVGLLCVYRSHDFLRRVYGNYWGLCNLCSFIATEAGLEVGPITCVSSRAYVDNLKKPFDNLLDIL